MANIVYFIMFVLSVLNIVLLSVVVKQQRCFYYVTFFMLISISCFGYITIANAGTLPVALLGNILTYMGACFLPYCFLLCISELCQLPLKRWLSLLMFTYNTVVFFLVWITLDGSRLYYAGMELQQKDGITILYTQSGPLRFLYEISVVFYALAAVGVLLHAFRSRKNISYKNLWMLTGLELVTVIIYAFEKLANHTVDWVCLAYILDEFILLVLIYRIGKYDVSESIAGSINGQEDYAYMIFDLKLNYLGCSPMLKKYFPDITHVKVDRQIDAKGNKTIEKAVAWLTSCTITGIREPLYIKSKGRDLKCTWRPINNGLFGRKSGYLVELFDDTNQQKYLSLISNYNTQLEGEVAAKLEHIQEMQDQIIIGISDIVESRDNSTGGHVKRTSEAVRIFMEQLSKESAEFHMTKRYCENVIKAAPMHDLGKIAVEDQILRKPGRFTEEEYNLMKVHAAVGAQIVEKALNGVDDAGFMEVTKNMAHYHHEKWNGKGYPEGLAGEKIPLEARIMALADVFDALVSKRCYKDEYSYDEAFRIIEESLGSHFDPELGKIFMNCRPELEAYYNQIGK
ncbi:MAG: HD domain-containing protein [Lachnospiraceae bacterium]|nr:HD domain-containing protein [Lachnospiraceae bacterium]